jgi:hypothetical protein
MLIQDARYALPQLQPSGVRRASERHGDRERAAGKEKYTQRPEKCRV